MSEVRLKNISKSFERVSAVENVSFEINDGELFFLLGPSGCGKTTCLRTIAGFVNPDAGEIYFDGKCVNTIPPHRRQTGMVFQNYALWPHMTVYQNVEYGLTLRRINKSERKKRVGEMLDVVRMSAYSSRKPNQLSGGEQQRVALARALVVQPKILLLDEPLANLDALLRLELRQEIKRVQKELKITTLYVTHDQKEALALADRIAVMNNGRICQAGMPKEIYHSPADSFVANFVGETNLIKGKIISVKDNFCEAETQLGNITAPLTAEITKGEALFSIRPESVIITRSPSAGINRFKAKITNTAFLGETGEYMILLNKAYLKIKVQDPREMLRVNDEVFVFLPPENIMALKDK